MDHKIVRCAAKGSGHALAHYEDFPYAEQAELTKGQYRPELILLSEEALEAKIAAIACYRSQLSTFWTNAAEMAAAVRAFAERTGSSRLAERYWK